jgi:lysyl-tRNA synthetase class 2
MNHPLDISPLAKKKTADTVRRFQLVVGGLEMVNAFSELNDPIDQRERFIAQEQMGRDGEEETHLLDEALIEALEYGMPPAAGAAIGLDRLVRFLTDTKNIRVVVLFPTMRPK